MVPPPPPPTFLPAAAYGGFFIIASLFWGWGVDGVRPDTYGAPSRLLDPSLLPALPHLELPSLLLPGD